MATHNFISQHLNNFVSLKKKKLNKKVLTKKKLFLLQNVVNEFFLLFRRMVLHLLRYPVY